MWKARFYNIGTSDELKGMGHTPILVNENCSQVLVAIFVFVHFVKVVDTMGELIGGELSCWDILNSWEGFLVARDPPNFVAREFSII